MHKRLHAADAQINSLIRASMSMPMVAQPMAASAPNASGERLQPPAPIQAAAPMVNEDGLPTLPDFMLRCEKRRISMEVRDWDSWYISRGRRPSGTPISRICADAEKSVRKMRKTGPAFPQAGFTQEAPSSGSDGQ